MMPMSFGKPQRAKPGSSKPQRASGEIASSSSAPSAPSAEGANGSPSDTRTVAYTASEGNVEMVDDGYDDDGLTAEEREANRKALEAGDEDEDDQDDGEDDVDLGPEPIGPDIHASLPIDDKVQLKDHSKAVSALSIDAAGARIATGSYDYDVKLWDFGGMSQSFKPFKTFEPWQSYLIHDLAWSPNGDALLVATGTAQAKVYDRDGIELATYKKGDVYIRDMKNTSGHVAEITSCFWHSFTRNLFATTSADSTIRLWDVEDKMKQQTVVVVKSKERGTRTKVTCGAFSQDGKMLAAGCLDGALHLWSTSGTYSRPNATIEGAHERNTETSSVCFSKDGRTLASRGGDGTVKLWDVRNIKRPLAQRSGLHNAYGQTNVIFSSDESALLTGTSVERAETRDGSMGKVTKEGSIEVLSRSDLSSLKTIRIDDHPSSVIRLAWHPRINQLFASTSSGAVHLFFSPVKSIRGALLCVGKRARTRPHDDDSLHINGPIITPGAMDAQDRGQGVSQMAKKRRMEKIRQDPLASRMPERPLDGPGKGGRIGAAATQHMVQSIFNENTRAEDPREALLKYAQQAEEDPQWTRVWKKTQPKPIFQDVEEEEEDGKK